MTSKINDEPRPSAFNSRILAEERALLLASFFLPPSAASHPGLLPSLYRFLSARISLCYYSRIRTSFNTPVYSSVIYLDDGNLMIEK